MNHCAAQQNRTDSWNKKQWTKRFNKCALWLTLCSFYFRKISATLSLVACFNIFLFLFHFLNLSAPFYAIPLNSLQGLAGIFGNRPYCFTYTLSECIHLRWNDHFFWRKRKKILFCWLVKSVITAFSWNEASKFLEWNGTILIL